MIDFSRNHFELFGLPTRFRLDPDMLDRAYRELQNAVHPDRFAAAAETERRLALQSSARVNEAYTALKDPVTRAQYLLTLHGIDALAETDSALPVEFLERQLARREAADDAMTARDTRTLQSLLVAVRADAAGLEQRLAEMLDDEADREAARLLLREFKFLAKLGRDIDAMLGELEG